MDDRRLPRPDERIIRQPRLTCATGARREHVVGNQAFTGQEFSGIPYNPHGSARSSSSLSDDCDIEATHAAASLMAELVIIHEFGSGPQATCTQIACLRMACASHTRSGSARRYVM